VILQVTQSHKRTKDVVTRCVFESPNAFAVAARTRYGLWGSLSAPPDLLAAIGGGVLLLRGREGKKGRERGGEGEKGGLGNLGKRIASSLFNFWLQACEF